MLQLAVPGRSDWQLNVRSRCNIYEMFAWTKASPIFERVHRSLKYLNSQDVRLDILMKKLHLLAIISLLCTVALSAQQSSKAKSKDRFREKSEDATPSSAKNDLQTANKPEMARMLFEVLRQKDHLPIQGVSIFIFSATRDSLINTYHTDASSQGQERRPIQRPNDWENMPLDKPDLYSNAEGGAMMDLEKDRYYWVLVRANGHVAQKRFVHVQSTTPLRLRFELQE